MDRHELLLRVSILGVLLVVVKEQSVPIIQNVLQKKDEEQEQSFNLSDFIGNYRIVSVSGTTIAVGIMPKTY